MWLQQSELRPPSCGKNNCYPSGGRRGLLLVRRNDRCIRVRASSVMFVDASYNPPIRNAPGRRLPRCVHDDSMDAIPMKPVLRMLLTCHLVLCLAVGGVVAWSPVLHRLVEHGGQGPAHAHGGGVVIRADREHEHGDGRWHHHESPRPSKRPRAAALLRHSHGTFELPGISLAYLWEKLGDLLQNPARPAPAREPDGSRHEHQGFFALLAGGLVEQPLEVSLPPVVPTSQLVPALPAVSLFVASDWDAQTAPRGPPTSRG